MKRLLLFVLFFAAENLAFSAHLDHPIIFVKQVKVDHSGGTIQDLFGNFRGTRPSVDQPVGGGLFILSTSGEAKQLVGGSNVAVRDPEISFDGHKVIFSMKQGGNGKWQIWECDVDGNNLKRLSTDPNVNDLDPAYIPYERIVFVSDWLHLADPYKNLPSAQLHWMRPDGTERTMMNANPSGHSNPVSLYYPKERFGVVLFTQFDHHDRRKNTRQSFEPLAVNRFLPWFVYRDGSAFDHPFFGTHTIPDFKGGYVSTRGVSNSTQLVGVLADEEKTFGAGSIVKMKYRDNDDREKPVFFTPNVFGVKEENPYGRWRDPYPLADGSLVASYASGPVYQYKPVLKEEEIPNFKIVRISKDGLTQETLYEDKNFWCWQPVEVTFRRSYAFSIGVSRADVKYAMINSLDVFNRGRDFQKVVNGDQQPALLPGSISFVRILKSVRTQNANRSFRAYSATKFVELGKVPVSFDGSFAALVPADTPLMWELLDRSGKAVVRERFGATLKAGEIRQCGGCHAPHNGHEENTTNDAVKNIKNLTRFDPDVNKNGIFDILEDFGVPGY